MSKYEGVTYIHIREYEKKASGGRYPTKRGVALNESRLAAFLLCVDDITRLVEEDGQGEQGSDHKNEHYQKDLGGAIQVTVKKQFKCIDFRRFFKPEQEIIPTKCGVIVKFSEWSRLVKIIKMYRNQVGAFENPSVCGDKMNHCRPIDAWQCKECNAYEYLNYC